MALNPLHRAVILFFFYAMYLSIARFEQSAVVTYNNSVFVFVMEIYCVSREAGTGLLYTSLQRPSIIPYIIIYRVSQEECARLRESVPYVKVYRYNPKHLYLKFNGYGDNGQRKVRSSCGSMYCTFQLTRYVYTAHVLETGMQSTLCLRAHVKCLEP